MNCNLGNNIKIIRKKRNFSQEYVANKMHVDRTTISKWENNYK